MAKKAPPPPKCDCTHAYGIHQGGMKCKFRADPNDEDTECSCGKFRVPAARSKHSTKARGKSGWGMRTGSAKGSAKSSAKGTPWWWPS